MIYLCVFLLLFEFSWGKSEKIRCVITFKSPNKRDVNFELFCEGFSERDFDFRG